MAADGSGAILPPELTEEFKKANEAIRNAMTAFREVKDENEATKRNIEQFFSKYEDLNQVHAKNYAAFQKAVDERKQAEALLEQKLSEGDTRAIELQKRLDNLVMGIASKGGGGSAEDNARDSAEYKAFFDLVKKGVKPQGGLWAFRPDVAPEIKALRTDSDVQGGYLIPQVMDNEIRKKISEISPVRNFARVRVAPNKTMDIPVRLSIPAALYEGEGETAPSDQSTYGSEQITLYRQTIKVPATLDMMVSSAFDLEREIAADVSESMAIGEGKNFVKGTGVKSPQGFTKDSRVETVTSASAGTLSWDDMIEVASKLKRGQNPWYFMNRRTIAYLQKVKSTIGVPIWQPVAGNVPATIWGFPYSSDFIDLDDAQNGSGSKAVVFGDLRRAYEIYDMLGINVVRDDLTKADQAITQWIFRRYNYGRVIMPEALKILQIQ